MPLVSAIIAYADRKFPNTETEANKISDLNDIHKALYVKLTRLKNDITVDATDYTVADQLAYSLPDYCTFDNIVSVKVAQTTGAPTNATLWDTFEYAGANESKEVGDWYAIDETDNTKIALWRDGLPITTASLYIKIYFYARPVEITTRTQTPSLHADYHDLLKYRLIQTLASQGANPDVEIADYYQDMIDEFMRDVQGSLADRDHNASGNSNQVNEYF